MKTHTNKTNYVNPLAVNFHRRAPGFTTKFWLFPDGHAYDTEGKMHFRWAQGQANFLRDGYQVKLGDLELRSDDEQTVRLALIRQGMIRINHCCRQNKLTVEGCETFFTEAALAFLRRLVTANSDDIVSVSINSFNAEASAYTNRYLNLIGKFDPASREAAWQSVVRGFSKQLPATPAATKTLAEAAGYDASPIPHNSPLILHIPHAATAIPEPFRAAYLLDEGDLTDELRKMTDWFTDELFTQQRPLIPAVRFPYSRLLVDVERFADDAEEPMARHGMGVFYTRTSDGRPLRPTPEGETADQLRRYYDAHQSIVRHTVDTTLARHGQAFIIDCHSFPASALPCHDYASPSDIAFGIGTDPDHTPPWLTDWLAGALASDFGKVTVNAPFAGSSVPPAHL